MNTEADLEDLGSLVLVQEPGLDLHDLIDYFKQAESLDQAIRQILGMDAVAVQTRFSQHLQSIHEGRHADDQQTDAVDLRHQHD